VFDPFAGSGTTGVEALRNNRNFIGIEINPLSAKIASTKTAKLSSKILLELNTELLKIIETKKHVFTESEKPYLLNRDHWFKDFVQNDLLNIRDAIEALFKILPQEINKSQINDYKDFYYITLSAIIRNVSNADTMHVFPGVSKRMRRLEAEGAIHIDVKASFSRAIHKRALSYKIYENITANRKILLGDTTKINLDKYKSKCDLIITNPPYISSVRYIETLKLEMYWLGFITSSSEYVDLAHKMLGNDRLAKAEYNTIELTKYEEINTIIKEMEQIDKKSAKIIADFFTNIELVIQQMNHVLKLHKHVVIKISDSKIKKHVIETGKLMTLIAEHYGFKLTDVFTDKINDNSRSLLTARNTYSDIITYDYIVIWEKINEI
jgi:DNA modification methylase